MGSLKEYKSFTYKPEEGQNPYIGFMSFQHFRGESMFSDIVVRPEANRTETERVECYPISPDAEDIDLSGIALNNLTAAEQVVRCFHAPKRIQMHNCGVPDEDMDTLRQRYPDTEFVWTVKIGKISLRTDVTYFMPYQYFITASNIAMWIIAAFTFISGAIYVVQAVKVIDFSK